MDKKKFISKTILFIFIVLFITVFKKVFGSENTLIGVTVITSALMLMERDLTLSPMKHLLYLIGINISLGMAAHVASHTMWLAIPINFITIFLIGFVLRFEFKSDLYVPFGLQYLFMLNAPVAESQLHMRILALVFGAFFIMALQFIANGKKSSKVGDALVERAFKELLSKVDLLIKGESTVEIEEDFLETVTELKRLVYNKRKNYFYLTIAGSARLNIGAALEMINIIINNLDIYLGDQVKHNRLISLHAHLNALFMNRNDVKLLQGIKMKPNAYGHSGAEEELNLLCDCLIKWQNIDSEDHIKEQHPINREYKFINTIKREFTLTSWKFSYALRLAFCITLSFFFMDYFQLPEIRWVGFTAFALILPYSEHSIAKSKQRVKGTSIGVLFFIILFSIFKSMTARSLIIMAVGYLDGFNTRYDRKMVCITISALGVASMTSTIGGVVFYRLLFVGVGLVLTLLANKYILPYNLDDAIRDLKKVKKAIVNQLILELHSFELKRDNQHNIENLYMMSTFTDQKLKTLDEKGEHAVNVEENISIKEKYKCYLNIRTNSQRDESENKPLVPIY